MNRALLCVILIFSPFITGCAQSAPPQNGGTQTAGPGGAAKNSPKGENSEIPLIPGFGEAALTTNYYFIVDGSASMNEAITKTDRTTQKFRSRLEGAKWAIHEFAGKLPDDCNIGLFVFDAKGAREVLPLGPKNKTQFLAAVDAIKADQKTPLGEAIQKGVEALTVQYQKQLGYGDYRLIVVTDGESNGQIPLPAAAKFAKSRKFQIHTIGLCMQGDHELRKWSASYKAADSAKDLKEGLEEAIGESTAFDPKAFGP